MTDVPLGDILISARQESHRMRHFYLGLEHIFIALLSIRGGLAASILADEGFAPEYVIDAIRRKAGKGGKRLWAGFPNTPRTDVVLAIAAEIAAEFSRQNILERDLLVAALEENESLPVRVLRSLAIDVEGMRNEARTREVAYTSTRSFVKVILAADFEGDLTPDQLFILRRMFSTHPEVRVEKRLTGGYTPATVLVVTPVHADKRIDSSVVVKISSSDIIQDEAYRYEQYVKNTLPPLTARLEERPTAPESTDLAALKYTLITDEDGNPRDMRSVLREWSGKKLGEWLATRLYDYFGEVWWKQRNNFRFDVWQEYDRVLPPVLTLELVDENKIPADRKKVLRPRRFFVNALEFGDYVIVEDFIVHRVNHENNSIQLALKQGTTTNLAYQIEIRGINFNEDTYYRQEVVERIAGRVWKTRREQLTNAVRELEPDFDIQSEYIPLNENRIENPLAFYARMLEETIDGTFSTIHGDLHPGNILIGANDSALLIDFARTREGHTIFDWATLEMSLLSEVLIPLVENDWNELRQLAVYIRHINQNDTLPDAPDDIRDALQAVLAIRRIVRECLANADKPVEYYIAVAMCGLRAMTWATMDQASRRLMYLISGVMVNAYISWRDAASVDDGIVTDFEMTRNTRSTDNM